MATKPVDLVPELNFATGLDTDLLAGLDLSDWWGNTSLRAEDLPTRADGGQHNVIPLRSEYARWCKTGWLATLDRIIAEIGRLPVDWDGPGCATPSEQALRDIESTLSVLPAATTEPEVEVDSSDGSVACRWWSQDFSQGLSITFTGRKEATFVFLVPGGRTAERCTVSDETKIIDLWHEASAQMDFLHTDA